MTLPKAQQYLKNHHIDDYLLNDFINRKLYDVAAKEIPRVIHALELKIYALENLNSIIELEKAEEEKGK